MTLPRYPKYKISEVSWLGEVPEHWEVVQSRRLFSQRKKRARPTDKQLTASQEHGVIFQDDFMEREGRSVMQVIHGADILKHVEPRDFVISMRSFQGGLEWCGERGCISSAYVMLTPSQKIEPRFFRYLFKSQRYIQALQSTTNLVRDGQALRFENFTLLDLPYLQSEEQLAIADFLDSELGKIDALVEEQRRLIELLKEKRQAVISHAVTKGLNPNTSMKDSGIEWLGPVPAHWHVKPLKFLIGRNGLIRGPFGGDLKKEIFQESGIKIYEQKNAIYRDAHLGDSYISESKFADMARFRVSEGDYIMSCSGTIGKAFRLPEGAPTGIINQALLIIRFSDCLCYQFANWVFESSFFTEQILDNSQGGAMKNLVGLGVFTSIALPVPPITEQQSIGCHLSTKAAKLDALIVEATHAIDLLQERRTALISAAVTGKIDVRGLATEEAA